ncbi:MAG TPA: hypothetical protein VGA21_02740 [Cyclobacteriaceae bacterium]
MNLVEVLNPKQEKLFIQFAVQHYRNEPKWIRPLDKDIRFIFNKKKNKSYRNGGESIRWLLYNNDEIIGRIAAFYNPKLAGRDNEQPTGGVGFFECIDDQNAASMLFEVSKDWLKDKGMEAMDGPVNFGDRDAWWGLLVEGFNEEPNYRCNYNYPYYQPLFENYGFQLYFRQLTYARKTADPLSPKLHIKAEMISSDPGYSFAHFRKKQYKRFAQDFMNIYNQAWAGHVGVPKLTPAQAELSMKLLLPIVDEKIIWFGYYKNEPVAFFIMLPEVNQIFKYVRGKLDIMGKLIFLWHKWNKTCRKMIGVVFGVVPEHQGKGVEGAIIMAARKMVQDDYARYEDFEMNWIGDFNPKMIRVVEQVGAHVSKVHNTYRYLFDRNVPFKRMPIKN